MQKSRLIITAGHQGPGTGASRQWFDEGKEAIVLRDLVTVELKKLGVVAINDSNATDLPKILAWLNRNYNQYDFLVDIHFNVSVNEPTSGTEVFVQNKANDAELNIAQDINDITANLLEISERGVKRSALSQHGSLGILDRTKLNACLWEVCFLSNRTDCQKYYEKRDELAVQIAAVLASYVLK